mgnify:CR=1 FL=1
MTVSRNPTIRLIILGFREIVVLLLAEDIDNSCLREISGLPKSKTI